MAKFSVVIPVYNASRTIRRCVESIERNTFNDFDVIMVEDASKDDSWQICQELAGQYTNIIAIRNEENRGVSYTRNRGLEKVSGEYVMFVDSDDWVENSYFERFAAVLDQYKNAFPICGYVNHDEKYNGRRDERRWNEFEGFRVSPLQNELEELKKNTLLQQLWNKAFLTEVIRREQLRFDESISIGEDFRFVLAYLKVGSIDSVVLLNETLYHYMRDQLGSLMYRVGYEGIEESLKNLRAFYYLQGANDAVIEQRMAEERRAMVESQAYLITHNVGMGLREKKKLILALDREAGTDLYRRNLVLYGKERLAILLEKAGIRRKD